MYRTLRPAVPIPWVLRLRNRGAAGDKRVTKVLPCSALKSGETRRRPFVDLVLNILRSGETRRRPFSDLVLNIWNVYQRQGFWGFRFPHSCGWLWTGHWRCSDQARKFLRGWGQINCPMIQQGFPRHGSAPFQGYRFRTICMLACMHGQSLQAQRWRGRNLRSSCFLVRCTPRGI